jgi:mRNA interferase RelE/StbE
MYCVIIAPSVEKDLRRIAKADRKLHDRLFAAIESLAISPRAGKQLCGVLKGTYSYRVGDWRILYEICEKEVVVSVVDLGHRREIYE